MRQISRPLLIITLSLIAAACTQIGSRTQDSAAGDAHPDSRASSPAPAARQSKSYPARHNNPQNSHWGYTGSEGPEEWANLNPAYQLCEKGHAQSPVDISGVEKASLGRIRINYKSGPSNIVNNGHTVQVNMRKGSYMIVARKKYRLLQFHFHAPSEHTVNGKPADMVIHFVHQARNGKLAVLAVLLESCNENNIIGKLWRSIPLQAGDKKRLSRKINIAKLLPTRRAYYQYTGSLTTPPCTEGVNWMILKSTMTISDAQKKTFTDIFPNSIRPIQPKNDRVIKLGK